MIGGRGRESEMRRLGFVVVAVAGLAMVAGPAGMAGARTRTIIEVFPGPNAIRSAIGSAVPGDVLNIHAGTYEEFFDVDVAGITLQSAGDGTVTVDGGCRTSVVIDVVADNVSVIGLTVTGASGGFEPIDIDFSFVSNGRVADSVFTDTCGDTLYGINVFNGDGIKIFRNVTTGFGDTGIYIGGVVNHTAPLVVANNESYANNRGIILEDSSRAVIRVFGNNVHDNQDTGIWVNSADGMQISRNTATNNGHSGIEVNAFSDNNNVRHNRSLGHPFDLINGGGDGNCFLDNDYVTSQGNISC
jgi:parallel beta-helix repeat protein